MGCGMTTRQARDGSYSSGLRWVTALLVGSLLTSACTSDPGVNPTGSGVISSGVEQITPAAQTPAGPASTPPDSTLLLPAASTPAELQVDQDVAAALEARFGTPGYRALRSVLVLADGRTVLERYYQSDQSDYHHIFSVTKSVISTLIGIAIGQGKLQGVDQTLAELLPAYASSMSPAVAATTLEQVLTMTGGFHTNDPGRLPTEVRDWVAKILADSYSPPGVGFHYSDAGSHLLSAILAQATGMPTLDYARAVLFDPLGIPSVQLAHPGDPDASWESFEAADFAWAFDPQGVNIGGWGLRLRARDMAKIGLLYLNGGRWQGQQVVPADWVRPDSRQELNLIATSWIFIITAFLVKSMYFSQIKVKTFSNFG